MAFHTIPQLPNEILEDILLCISPQRDSKESVRALCNFGLACSRFLALSRLPHIWKSHYAARWRRCERANEDARLVLTSHNWYDLYTLRSNRDVRAIELLDHIIFDPNERVPAALELVPSMGYDIWEIMASQANQVEYSTFMTTVERSEEIGEEREEIRLPISGLTRQYWAKHVTGMIARFRALNIWRRLVDGSEEVSYEHGLAAFSSFFGEDIDRIFEELDRLASECRSHLSSLNIPLTSLPITLIEICNFMRQKGFQKADLIHYHNLMNHFPHRVLFEEHLTLPMSLVYVFVCIARRLGIDAHPVQFPHKVIAIVTPQTGDPIYVDVFESASRPLLSYDDLRSILAPMGLLDSIDQYSQPASTISMVLRAVGNIIHSLNRIRLWGEDGQKPAHYAAYAAALMLTHDLRLVQVLFVSGVGGPLDSEVVLRYALKPALPVVVANQMDIFLERQAESERAQLSGERREGVAFYVGMLFKHRKFHYLGLIKDWDLTCEATEEWILQMRVDDLIRGRDQPFYQSLISDGHTRYVAEENIQPCTHPDVAELYSLISAYDNFGRWFDGLEVLPGGRMRFRLSPESQLIHSEDEVLGRATLLNGSLDEGSSL